MSMKIHCQCIILLNPEEENIDPLLEWKNTVYYFNIKIMAIILTFLNDSMQSAEP